MAQHILWINQNNCVCNRKTEQWHVKPTLAEYRTMNVYCIVNKLKTLSEWDKVMEESPRRCWLSLLLTFDCEAVKVCEREGGDELGTRCHVSSATSGTEQWGETDSVFARGGLWAQIASTTKLNFKGNWKLKLTCSWAFSCTVMPVFCLFFFFKLKNKQQVGGGCLGH